MITHDLLARCVSAADHCRLWPELGRVLTAVERTGAPGSPVYHFLTPRVFLKSHCESMMPRLVSNKNYSTTFGASLAGESKNGWRRASRPPLTRTIFRAFRPSPSSGPPFSSKTKQIKLSGMISKADSSTNLLRLFAENEEIVDEIHLSNLWNKLGRQRDASDPRHRQEIRRMIQRTVDLIHSCGPRELANIAHGAAKARLGSEEAGILFEAIESVTLSKGLLNFNPQELSNMVWAFATVGLYSDILYKMVAKEAVHRKLRGFKPQEISNMVWSFATAGVHADKLYELVANEVVERQLRGFKSRDLSNMVWAFTTANIYHVQLFEEIKLVFSQFPVEKKMNKKVLSSLHLCMVWLRLEYHVPDDELPFPDSMRCECKKAMEDSSIHVSRLQRNVGAILAEVCPGFEEEFKDEHTSYSIDLALHSSLIAIEVDGPSHFISSSTEKSDKTLNGSTLLKQRLLAAAGWKVISIPYFEWNALSDQLEKKEYLEGLLNEAGLNTSTAEHS